MGEVREAGARPQFVERSAEQLDAMAARLNTTRADKSVIGWYADVARNRIVVQVEPGGSAAASTYLRWRTAAIICSS